MANNNQLIPIGIVAPAVKGNWLSAMTYNVLNIVRHNNATYMSKVKNVGIEPGVSTSWENTWILIAHDGIGVSQGGLQGEVLVKKGQPDYETEWIPQSQLSVGNSENAQNDQYGNNIANSYANALKAYVSNQIEFCNIVDNSPIEHEMEVTVSQIYSTNPPKTIKRLPRNVLDLSPIIGKTVYVYSQTLGTATLTCNSDGGITGSGTPEQIVYFVLDNLDLPRTQLTLTAYGNFSGMIADLMIYSDTGLLMNRYRVYEPGQSVSFDVTRMVRDFGYAKIELKRFENYREMSGTMYVRIEQGDSVEYEIGEGGIVKGVTSTYPNTALFCDGGRIEVKYNRDLNKAFTELYNAIISLGGNV